MNGIRNYNHNRDIVYYRRDSYGANKKKWIRCGECGKFYKLTSKKKCPHCESSFKEESAFVFGPEQNRKGFVFYNDKTMMFIDDDVLTISMMMFSVEGYEQYHVKVGEHNFRLKVRFNLKKRTSLLYARPMDRSDGFWENFFLNGRFNNFTQPASWYDGEVDINLPTELIADFCKSAGLKVPDERVAIDELAWLNRLRTDMSDVKRQRFMFREIKEKLDHISGFFENNTNAFMQKNKHLFIKEYKKKYDCDFFKYENRRKEANRCMMEITRVLSTDDDTIFVHDNNPFSDVAVSKDRELSRLKVLYDEVKYFNKIFNRMKTYYKTGHKVKNYDEDLFNALCILANMERSKIPKHLEKHYYLNPYSLNYASLINEIFKNDDVAKNMIAKVEKFKTHQSLRTRLIPVHREDALIAFSGLSSHDELKKMTDKESGKIEAVIANKIGSFIDANFLSDTTRMLNQIKSNKMKISRKGNMQAIHEKASRLVRRLRMKNETYASVKDIEDTTIVRGKNLYRFSFIKNTFDLVKVSEDMNICVASYNQDCVKGRSLIAAIYRNEKLEGCLEFVPYDKTVLMQAKGNCNGELRKESQEIIVDYCNDRDIVIKTDDIRYRDTINQRIKQIA